jgi:hypothetical protein
MTHKNAAISTSMWACQDSWKCLHKADLDQLTARSINHQAVVSEELYTQDKELHICK